MSDAPIAASCVEQRGAADCGCGFPSGSACERLSTEWFSHATRTVQPEALAWMEALPRRVDIEFAGRRLAVVHGGVRSINRFIFPSTDVRIKNKELDAAASDGGIAGHCGFPFSQLLGTRLWHNAGAIGLPANDGTPRGWYSVLTGDQSGIFITHRALEYDYQSAAAKMRLAHLPEEYANALETGFWPSLDILPEKEIRHRGTRLEERSVFWPALISSSSEAPTEATLQH